MVQLPIRKTPKVYPRVRMAATFDEPIGCVAVALLKQSPATFRCEIANGGKTVRWTGDTRWSETWWKTFLERYTGQRPRMYLRVENKID